MFLDSFLQIPVCVNGLQAVGSCITHLNVDLSALLPALDQVHNTLCTGGNK